MVITRRPTIELTQSTYQDGAASSSNKNNQQQQGPIRLLSKGICLTIIGILLTIWTPFQLMMEERLRMHRGLPPFVWWETPPELIYLRVRIFNYTNLEAFMEGSAAQLHVQELGPIVYKEIITHENATFNDNSTITYLARHRAVYQPELNTINLNDTIIVPNYAILIIASVLQNMPFFVKMGTNMMMRRLGAPLTRNITIYNFLWNFTDPLLDFAHKIAPSMAPVNNIGMLHRVYSGFEDTVTMYIGNRYGHERFSLIERLNGEEHVPFWRNCDDKVTNATEGVTYNQYLTRTTTLKYWRRTICKVVDLTYERDLVHSGLNAFRYTLAGNTFDRTQPAYNDCYKGHPTLPNGLSDLSACMFDVPIAASFPHFLYGDDKIRRLIHGLEPNVTNHGSFMVAEPVIGLPLESMARSQSNLVVRNVDGYSPQMSRYNGAVLPMFWLEYHQIGIPFKIKCLVYLVVVITQPAQTVFILCLIFFGFVYVMRAGKTILLINGYRQLLLQTSSNRCNITDDNSNDLLRSIKI